MSNSQQLEDFLQKNPDIEIFEAIIPDLNGKIRGKWLPREKITKVFNGEFKLPVTTSSFDIWGRDAQELVYDYGDEDVTCIGDASTLARVPWLARPTAQILLNFAPEGQKYCVDSHLVLQRVLDRYKAAGLTPVVAAEMEFYLFTDKSDGRGVPEHTQKSQSQQMALGGDTYGIDSMQEMSDFMYGVFEAAKEQNLPIDTLICEAAPSQYEINLHHQPDAIKAVQQAVLLKRAIQGVAKKLNYRASFMAKPFGDQPGSGMHVHFSVLDKDGNNIFDNQTDKGSDKLRYAINGCLQTMPDSMALFAPNLNSYRRFQVSNHVPLTPLWGYDNRTTAIRVPGSDPKAMRIEHRVTGADANPFLIVAAMLAGALKGIEDAQEPTHAVKGNAYTQFQPSLPQYWPDALQEFENSAFIKQWLGEDFHTAWCISSKQEMRQFDNHVTGMEYDSYL